MTKTNKPRAIIYARLACKDKWTDTRLDAQVEVAKKLADEHGLIVDKVIVEVASGSSVKQRPGLRAVLEQAKSGEVSHVVVADMTRLLRSGKAADWRHISEAFADGNVRVLTQDGIRSLSDLDRQLQALGMGTPSGRDKQPQIY